MKRRLYCEILLTLHPNMLTNTLRTLKEDGLVTRTVYAEVPPRVEYGISDRTRTLLPHINSLIEWAKDNMTAILSDRASCKR